MSFTFEEYQNSVEDTYDLVWMFYYFDLDRVVDLSGMDRETIIDNIENFNSRIESSSISGYISEYDILADAIMVGVVNDEECYMVHQRVKDHHDYFTHLHDILSDELTENYSDDDGTELDFYELHDDVDEMSYYLSTMFEIMYYGLIMDMHDNDREMLANNCPRIHDLECFSNYNPNTDTYISLTSDMVRIPVLYPKKGLNDAKYDQFFGPTKPKRGLKLTPESILRGLNKSLRERDSYR